MKEIILGFILLIQGMIDLRYKEIPVWISVAGAVVGIVISLLEKREMLSILLAILPGVIALLFAKVSRETIGYGDGVLFLVMGMYMSWEEVLEIVILAFGIAGVCALILIVVFQKKRNYQIPFVPFLAASYLLCLEIGGMGR